jgi:hypothetical protein
VESILMTTSIEGFAPQRLWIQRATIHHPIPSYLVTTTEDVITTLLTNQTLTQAYRPLQEPPEPWNQPVKIALTHECTNRERAKLPPRLQTALHQMSPSPSPDEHSIPSSPTSQTSRDSGETSSLRHPGSAHPSLSSTTATTSTSSTAHSVEVETQSEPGNELPNSCALAMLEIQKWLSHPHASGIFGDSSTIACVRVYATHTVLEIRIERN